MDMNIDTQIETRLSVSSFEELLKAIELKKKQIIKVTESIATRVAEEAAKDTYKSIEVVPATLEGKTAIAYVRSNDEIDTYREFGTGIVGSENPHVDEVLSKAGWKYDVNEHGEKGWWYPKEEGGFGWTQGQVAQKKFYLAAQRAKEKTPEIAKEEFQKYKK